MQVEIIDVARPAVAVGRCVVDMSMLPWGSAVTHSLQEPLQPCRGVVSVMVHALSEVDVRTWLQRAERWILDERREAFRVAGQRASSPERPSEGPLGPRVNGVPLLMAPPAPGPVPLARREDDEETEIEEYNTRSATGHPQASGAMRLALVVVRFVRGPKGFLEAPGDVHVRFTVHPLRFPKKHHSVRTVSRPRAGVMTFPEPLSLSLFKGPCRVEVRLLGTVNGEEAVVGEGAFDLPGQPQPKRHRELKVNGPVPGSSKRLQTEIHLEYAVHHL
eukprot:TRINITY_DN1963_c0_g1_i1.p2 TRINITY_DN1963_c0_g1~~TRINITY_DN1963_c0_g1_i1.p2  ORF type:complete len:292 (-),score=72.31 TRINITY_DN1963_c0_g1_i1:374-1198(-)